MKGEGCRSSKYTRDRRARVIFGVLFFYRTVNCVQYTIYIVNTCKLKPGCINSYKLYLSPVNYPVNCKRPLFDFRSHVVECFGAACQAQDFASLMNFNFSTAAAANPGHPYHAVSNFIRRIRRHRRCILRFLGRNQQQYDL